MTVDEVLKLLAEACAKAGSQGRWARAHRMSPGYVSDVLKRKKEPGAAILEALGLKKLPPRYEEVEADAPND